MAEQGNSTGLESTDELPETSQDGNITPSRGNETGHEFCAEGPSDARGRLNENAVDVIQAGTLQEPCRSRDVAETLAELPCSSVNTASISGSGTAFIEALKDRYRKTKAIAPGNLDKWAEPVDSKKDYFVDLKIEERNLLGLPSSNKEVTLRELFYTESEEGRRNKRTILVTGDAGFGKTTLTRKLCYDWAFPVGDYLSNFDLVLDIPLKSVGYLPDIKPLSKIKSSVLNEIYLNSGYEITDDFVLQDMNILFILDGLDETDESQEVISFVGEHLNRFQSSSAKGDWTVIVTSRPSAVDSCKTLLSLFDRWLSVSGFSMDNQGKYIRKTLPEDSAEVLIERVKRDPFLKLVSKSPLMLHLICCVHRKDGTSSISCRTELYLQIFKLRIELCAVKLGRQDQLQLRFGEISTIKEDTLFVQLGEFAYKYLLNEERRITKESLTKKFKEEFQFIIGLGILVAVRTHSNMTPIDFYEFTHITFAEFLSAIYVADKVAMSEMSLDTHCDEVLETGFFSGVLGEKIVQLDVVSTWLSRLAVTLSRMHDIKNEARLSEESWISFCSSITRVSFDCLSSDINLLESTDLPNLREIVITFNPPVKPVGNELAFEASKIFLLKFKSCELLRIAITVNVVYLSCSDEENDGFRVINMEGAMASLIEIANLMHSTRAQYAIRVNILSRSIVEVSDSSDRKESFLSRFTVKPIGILPDVLPNSTGSFGQWLYYKWKIGNIEIRYYIACEDDDVEKLAVPIIAVTPDEYKTISRKPFLHQSWLKVKGFKSSLMSNTTNDLKLPTTFGCVDCSTFLERLKEFRKETLSPWDEKGFVASGNSAESLFFSLLKKKYYGLTGSRLEDNLDDSDFSYLSDRFFGINEREVHNSDSEGFRFVETSHFTTAPEKENRCVVS